MKGTLVIAGRDIRAAFESPVAYILIAAFGVLSSLVFANFLFAYSDLSSALRRAAIQDPALLSRSSLSLGVVSPTLHVLSFLVAMLAPLLTMRALAEEKRQGTMEMLLTAPITSPALVVGKWLGALVVACGAVALTIGQPLSLIALAAPEAGPLATGYLGCFLVAAACTAIGLLASSLTDSTVVAAFLGFAFILASMACGVLGNSMSSNLGSAIAWLSVLVHFDRMADGLIDSGDVAFYALVTVGALFLTVRVLDSRRWR